MFFRSSTKEFDFLFRHSKSRLYTGFDSGCVMMNIEEEKEIVEKMKKKGNSEVEYAEGMLSVLAKVAEGMSPDQIKAYVNNTLRCLEND